MPHSAIRIAIVYQLASAYTRRLTAGATRFARPSRGFIAQEFICGELLQGTPASFNAWAPDAVICCIDGDEDALFQAVAPDGRPVVNMSRDKPRPGRGVVVAAASEQYDVALDHFRANDREWVAQFVAGQTVGCRATHASYREYAQTHPIPHHAFMIADEPEHFYHPERLNFVDPTLAKWLLALPHPVGVFSQQTDAAPYLCKSCKLLGLDVPGDIAIIGNDGLDVAIASDPPITTIRIPAEEIGYQAAKLASQMLSGRPAPRKPVTVSGVELTIRESSSHRKPNGCDIGKAVAFIERHACEGISVEDVRFHTQGISRNTFEKWFYESTRMRPIDAIRNCKLAEARRLLADSQVSITAIASICGYCDDLYFRKVFKAAEGVAPGEYRNLQQEQ